MEFEKQSRLIPIDHKLWNRIFTVLTYNPVSIPPTRPLLYKVNLEHDFSGPVSVYYVPSTRQYKVEIQTTDSYPIIGFSPGYGLNHFQITEHAAQRINNLFPEEIVNSHVPLNHGMWFVVQMLMNESLLGSALSEGRKLFINGGIPIVDLRDGRDGYISNGDTGQLSVRFGRSSQIVNLKMFQDGFGFPSNCLGFTSDQIDTLDLVFNLHIEELANNRPITFYYSEGDGKTRHENVAVPLTTLDIIIKQLDEVKQSHIYTTSLSSGNDIIARVDLTYNRLHSGMIGLSDELEQYIVELINTEKFTVDTTQPANASNGKIIWRYSVVMNERCIDLIVALSEFQRLVSVKQKRKRYLSGIKSDFTNYYLNKKYKDRNLGIKFVLLLEADHSQIQELLDISQVVRLDIRTTFELNI